MIGTLLDFEVDQLDAWDTQYRVDANMCLLRVIQHWLDGGSESEYPVTWDGFYSLLEDAECAEIAKELRKAVSLAVPPPAPHPPVVNDSTPTDAEETDNVSPTSLSPSYSDDATLATSQDVIKVGAGGLSAISSSPGPTSSSESTRATPSPVDADALLANTQCVPHMMDFFSDEAHSSSCVIPSTAPEQQVDTSDITPFVSDSVPFLSLRTDSSEESTSLQRLLTLHLRWTRKPSPVGMNALMLVPPMRSNSSTTQFQPLPIVLLLMLAQQLSRHSDLS